MSYSRDDTINQIRFYFKSAELLERAALVASQKAMLLSKGEKAPDFESLEISDDESELVLEFQKKAMVDIFSKLDKIMTGTIGHNTTITQAGTDLASYADVTDNEKAREATLATISQLIEGCLVDYILFGFYGNREVKKEAQEHYQLYLNGLNAVMQNSLILWY